MSNNSQIEINIIFGPYDQATIEGFSKDLAAIAVNWDLQTKATSFSVVERTTKRIKRKEPIVVSDLRRSQRIEQKQKKLLQLVRMILKSVFYLFINR